jgi:hypothetical protein
MASSEPVREQANCLSYTIDAADTIVAVSGLWDDFARDNDGESIVAEKIMGQKLDQFIHGDETLMFVRTMIMSARVLQRPVYRPYRCDSPKLKRFMEMTVQPRSEGSVEVMHRELRCEPIACKIPVAAESSGAHVPFVKRCSLCNRIRAEGVWSEIDEAAEAKRLPAEVAPLKVIYGVCPDCLASRGVVL